MNELLKRFQHKNWKRAFITGPTEVRVRNFEYVIGQTLESMEVFGDISMIFERRTGGQYDHPMMRDLWNRYLAFSDGCEMSYVPESMDANRLFFREFVKLTLRERIAVPAPGARFKDDYHELLYQVWIAAMKARYPGKDDE